MNDVERASLTSDYYDASCTHVDYTGSVAALQVVQH